MKAKRNNRGLTLIEVVASLGIIAVGLVGLLALFPVGIEASARAGDWTAAALLGEYVVDQVRLREDQVQTSDNTADALHALGWDEYDYDSKHFSFDAGYSGNFGSGEQIVWQRQFPNNLYDPDHPEDPNNGLSDQEDYSRYEVTLSFDPIEGNNGFHVGSDNYLMQVTVTVRWPRAFSDDARNKQSTMTFVTYICPSIP
jgi:prepilin-type N-terminal cleavage/methylation domain-containing protein